jgi:multiple sugar transport system substrate-binding protein
MKYRLLVVLSLVFVLTTIGTLNVLAQDEPTFMGMTAEELFPGAADEVERDTAMQALLAAELPDVTDRFAGQTLTVAVQQAGPRGGISGPYFYWRPVFEAVTGATLEIVEIPQAQYYTTTASDFLTGQNTYDVMNIGSWFYGDYIVNGWLQPIDQYINQEGFPMWEPENVATPLRELLQWDDQFYGALYDGDAQLLYYRKDILTDPEWQAQFEEEMGYPMPVPPRTWQQLLAVNSFFSGKDWNGDGDPDDGISLHLAGGGQGFFHFMSLSASFATTPADGDDPRAVSQYDNVYWFDPVDMTPLINQPGHVAALEYLIELAATGSDAQLGWELAEAWDNFLNGNAISTFSWGDVGSLAQDPSRSTITGNLGAAPIPCSELWYDRELGEFVEDSENPNCVGNVTGGSWHPVMSAFTDTPELAYYFMAMHANPSINFWNVTYGWTGVDPNSVTQLFEDAGGTATVDDYVSAGFDAGDAEEYISAYGANLFEPPITQTYLRILGTGEFWETMDTRLAQAMTGQLEPQEALDLVAEEWAQVNEELGMESQLEIYQDAIGFSG